MVIKTQDGEYIKIDFHSMTTIKSSELGALNSYPHAIVNFNLNKVVSKMSL